MAIPPCQALTDRIQSLRAFWSSWRPWFSSCSRSAAMTGCSYIPSAIFIKCIWPVVGAGPRRIESHEQRFIRSLRLCTELPQPRECHILDLFSGKSGYSVTLLAWPGPAEPRSPGGGCCGRMNSLSRPEGTVAHYSVRSLWHRSCPPEICFTSPGFITGSLDSG